MDNLVVYIWRESVFHLRNTLWTILGVIDLNYIIHIEDLYPTKLLLKYG